MDVGGGPMIRTLVVASLGVLAFGTPIVILWRVYKVGIQTPGKFYRGLILFAAIMVGMYWRPGRNSYPLREESWDRYAYWLVGLSVGSAKMLQGCSGSPSRDGFSK
jgi:hypothetical protein